MSKVFSVIPNICEGKDEKFIALLTEKLKQVNNLILLNVSMDKTRNRTVFSFTGTKEAIFEGGVILYEEANKHIDMRKHKGEYPRIGAVDVFPFVPLLHATIEEAISLANEFAEKISGMFKVPVYLFGESAKFPIRHDVENIRDHLGNGIHFSQGNVKGPAHITDHRLGFQLTKGDDLGHIVAAAVLFDHIFKNILTAVDAEIDVDIRWFVALF